MSLYYLLYFTSRLLKLLYERLLLRSLLRDNSPLLYYRYH